MAQLLITGSNEFHALTVVVVQYTPIIIDFQEVFKLGIGHDGDSMAWGSIQLELETHVATLEWMKGGGVGQSIWGEIEGEQGHVATGVDEGPIIVVQFACDLSPHVWQEHGGFTSLVGSGGLQQTSVVVHVFASIVVHQF